MTRRTYLISAWIRIWHWTNALLVLVLGVTGMSLHFADPKLPLVEFSLAVRIHNIAGVALIAAYAIFVVANIVSGNWWHFRASPAGCGASSTRISSSSRAGFPACRRAVRCAADGPFSLMKRKGKIKTDPPGSVQNCAGRAPSQRDTVGPGIFLGAVDGTRSSTPGRAVDAGDAAPGRPPSRLR